MTIAVADTSYLFALINPKDKNHTICSAVAQTLQEQAIIPVSVLPEIAYLLDSRLGHHVMRRFLGLIIQSDWQIEQLLPNDLKRSAELVERYSDSRLDFVDATIVAIAERLDANVILTLDQRHFRMIEPHGKSYLNILP